MRKRIVEVLVPVALDHTYSYGVPDGLELEPGDLVGVPLGASDTLGVVWTKDPAFDPRLDNRLKLELVRHAVRIGVVEGNRDQHLDDALTHADLCHGAS